MWCVYELNLPNFKSFKISDFVKGPPNEKSAILINFHVFFCFTGKSCNFDTIYRYDYWENIIFLKIDVTFFEKFEIDNHHLDEKILKKLIFLYIFYLVKTWISKISSRILSTAILPTTRPSKKVFYFSYFHIFYSFLLR